MELFYFLQEIAEKVFDGQRNFTYVYDVLLPEVVVLIYINDLFLFNTCRLWQELLVQLINAH